MAADAMSRMHIDGVQTVDAINVQQILADQEGDEELATLQKSQSLTFQQMRGCPRGVMVKAMSCGIVVREFVLQSHYYVHFRANTLGKGMNPLILPPAMGK